MGQDNGDSAAGVLELILKNEHFQFNEKLVANRQIVRVA
jgi:hypothetical protein